MKSIDFWFSIGSTYTYLSVTRVDSISKSENVIFNWIPFSVRKIMMEMDNIPFTPPSKKIKSDYMWRDIERRAQFYGLSPKLPAPYPLTQFDLANKIAILGMNEGWGINYVKNTYQRWFEEGKEPATEPNLSEIMEDMNLNKDEVLKKVNSPEIESIYQKNTSNAFQSGVFGSPTFIYEGEVFWGDDRLEDCIKWLNLNQTTEI
ncbi:MAG: 2-hydroxychromene-2-carboxylate isomerase [Rhizobiales bacterium TMED28]|nr:2-hydroxychromene-2-carboxylate isomerase [Rhodobiaceae bacterium]OUT81240.1 MAG: 2-hydroxychromene-2-carboxylate isomerase [Rhizobiales bacterium TMED28]